MPRTLQEILEHQDELAQRFEDYEPQPGDRRDPRPLESLRSAMNQRADAETALVNAVNEAREAGYAWGTIGNLLGTTGEGARQRYSKLADH